MNLNLLILLFPDGALLDCSFLAETTFVVLEWVGFFFAFAVVSKQFKVWPEWKWQKLSHLGVFHCGSLL